MTAPTIGENSGNPAASASDSTPTVQGSGLRRNRPGTKAAAFSQWPEESFENMDSTLAVQQYIQQVRKRSSLKLVVIDSSSWSSVSANSYSLPVKHLKLEQERAKTPQL